MNLTPFTFLHIFHTPVVFFTEGNNSRHFRDAKTEIRAMERFQRNLSELGNTVAASRESHQTQGFIKLLKCFLSVLNFSKCLRDLPAYAVSMIAWHDLWHRRCDNSKSCKAEETTWEVAALKV